MEKKIVPIQTNQIQVEFPSDTTPEQLSSLMESCENGTCGCDVDMKAEFESIEVADDKPQILFTVSPDKQENIIRRMEKCNC